MIWAIIVYLIIGIVFAEVGRRATAKGRGPAPKSSAYSPRRYIRVVVLWLPMVAWVLIQAVRERRR